MAHNWCSLHVYPRRTARSTSAVARRATLCTCTRCWNKSIQTPASYPRPWESWTPSSTTFSSSSLVRHRAWCITTSARLSHPGRSRPPCACCYLGSWPSTPCLRALRLSPSIPAPSKYNMPAAVNGEGNGTPLQYSCLENPMDRGPGGL